MLLSPDREPIGISSRLLVLVSSCPTFGLSVLSSGLILILELIFGVFLQATGCKRKFELPAAGADNWVEFRRRALAIRPR